MNPRKLSNKEMFELPDDWKNPDNENSNGWENPKVDITKYKPSIVVIWEVCQSDYLRWKNTGLLCQIYKGKFYIA